MSKMAEVKSKTLTEHYKGLEFKIKYLKEEYEHKEFIINSCGKEFNCEIKFNDDRQKFQAIVRHDGRTNSLSFFPVPKNAKDNIYMYISFVVGSPDNQNQKKLGD
jgi:hypothetical protein